MVHLYFLAAPRLRSKCRYASGGFRFVEPLLPLGVPLAGVALFAVQVCAADDGAGAEWFCVGEGHCFTLTPAASMASRQSSIASSCSAAAGETNPVSSVLYWLIFSGSFTTSAARDACQPHHAACTPESAYISLPWYRCLIRFGSSNPASRLTRVIAASNSALLFSSIPASLPAPAGHIVDSGAGDLQIERPLDLCCREPGLPQGDDHGPLQVVDFRVVVRLPVQPAVQPQRPYPSTHTLGAALGQLGGD